MKFLKEAHGVGVRNIEMESLQFGAFTHRLGLKATACCVTLLNRLEGECLWCFLMVLFFGQGPPKEKSGKKYILLFSIYFYYLILFLI